MGKGEKTGKWEFGLADGKWDRKRDKNQAVFPFSSQHPVLLRPVWGRGEEKREERLARGAIVDLHNL
jgi:hypothetical protein